MSTDYDKQHETATDYSMFEVSKEHYSWNEGLKTSLLIVLAIGSSLAMFALAKYFLNAPDWIGAFIGFIFIAGLWISVIYALLSLYKKLKINRQVIKKFADVNGWKYIAKPGKPEKIELKADLSYAIDFYIRFTVEGKKDGVNFKLYQIMEESLSSRRGKRLYSIYNTFLRVEKTFIADQNDKDTKIIEGAKYKYINLQGNIIYRDDAIKLFDSI